MYDYLNEKMSEFCKTGSTFTPTKLTDPNNKWLVRSAMQKAIRRGRLEEAFMCGEYLYDADPAYAWSGLQTVLVEDVGYPNFDLLNVGAFAHMKGWTEGHDRAKLFGGMIFEAAQAEMKTRACCELELGTNTQFTAFMAEKEKAPDGELIPMIVSENTPEIYVALKILRQRSRHGNTELMNDTIAMMQQYMPESWAPEVRMCPLVMWERPIDSMSFAMFPLMFHNVFEGSKPEDDVFPAEMTINHVSSSAFDMHTRAGKKAIRAFNTSLKNAPNSPLKHIEGDCVKPIGCALFIVEGGLMTGKLRSAQLDALREYQDTGFGNAYGLPEDDELREEIIGYVKDNIAVMNEKRVWASKL